MAQALCFEQHKEQLHPDFGESLCLSVLLQKLVDACRQDDVEIVDADASAAFAAYYAEDGRQADREVVYNPDLGLAIESLPAGMTLSDLWNVV